jgi:hypothetical protein
MPELSTIQSLVDFGMCIVLWLVQLVIYPGLLYIEESRLVAWHKSYTFRVSFIIMPLMLAQLSFAIYSAWLIRDALNLVVLALVLTCWILTFCISVPLHNRINIGDLNPNVRKRLIQTNWSRTVVWTLIFGLGLFA